MTTRVLISFLIALFCVSQVVGKFSQVTLEFIKSTGLEERDFHCINNVAYYITDSQWKTCLEAVQFCDLHNMKLLASEREPEDEYLRMYLENAGLLVPYWSSGQRMGEGWVWSALGKAINIEAWAENMPSTTFPGDLCIAMANDGWYSLPCDSVHLFICEWHPPLGELCEYPRKPL